MSVYIYHQVVLQTPISLSFHSSLSSIALGRWEVSRRTKDYYIYIYIYVCVCVCAAKSQV